LKILCVCAGGSCRSVTLATLLKYSFRGNHDVLAVSAEKNHDNTIAMLCAWADDILLVDEEFWPYIPESARKKTRVVPIGQDQWGMSMHPKLIPLAHQRLCEAGFVPRSTAEEMLRRRMKYVKRAHFGDWCDVCDAPQMVLPDGSHDCENHGMRLMMGGDADA